MARKPRKATECGVALPLSNKRQVWDMIHRGAIAAQKGMREGVPGSLSYVCHQEAMKEFEALALHFDVQDALWKGPND